jgi:hypothetical protein
MEKRRFPPDGAGAGNTVRAAVRVVLAARAIRRRTARFPTTPLCPTCGQRPWKIPETAGRRFRPATGRAGQRDRGVKDQRDEPAGFIITNPPYGKRLGEPEDAEAAYQKMADLGRRFPGWKLGIITDHPGFESHFGKKADNCKEITNGTIRSYIYQYEKL